MDFGKRFGGHFAVDVLEDRLAVLRAEILDDVGEIRRMHLLEQPVGDIQSQAAPGIRLEDVTELPANGVRRNAGLQAAHPARRQHSLHDPAENAPDSNVDLQHPQLIETVLLAQFEGNIVDPHHLAPLGIDDLLIEQVAHHAQHVLVGVVRGQVLVAKINTVQGDGPDLVVTDGQPGPAAANQVTVDANRVYQGNDSGVLDNTNPVSLKVEDLEAEQFGEKQKLIRHRWPKPIRGCVQ